MADRLAPPQVDKKVSHDDPGDGDYNIWYHSKPGKRSRGPERGVASSTKCEPSLHEGRTRGASGSDICLFFARGSCHLGHRCNRRHRLPSAEVEMAIDIQRDCFGRRREATEGDDQDGPGKKHLVLPTMLLMLSPHLCFCFCHCHVVLCLIKP
mmetsp:Transcript_42693/g.96627  ORF Transcript_42693/g.96627 Transcript_42693/m.96627 type:complete len:153 (+) Transcript_42693:40-498(+)